MQMTQKLRGTAEESTRCLLKEAIGKNIASDINFKNAKSNSKKVILSDTILFSLIKGDFQHFRVYTF